MPEIIGIGACALDMIAKIDHFPEPDEKIDAESYTYLPGGVTGNYITGVSRLGVPAGFIGAIGNDQEGQILLEDFKKESVDTSLIKIKKDLRSAINFIMVTKEGERVIIQSPYMIKTRLKVPEDIDLKLIKGVKLIHTTAIHKDVSEYVIKAAKKENPDIIISFDLEKQVAVQYGYKDIEKFIDLVDVLIPQKLGIMELTGHKDPTVAAKILMKKKPNLKIITVTLGFDGCSITTRNGDKIEQKTFPSYMIKPIDTTGAGDAFNAAFSVGYLKGWDIDKIADFANAAGALNCLKVGARTGMTTMEKVLKFMKENENKNNSKKNRK
ncbi:MAG: carbohydrate kinase family protein [Promethearchaeota archaeon]